ncbi:MAG: hypothetical protein JO216_20765 [Hyphomicrobiales bacterium]|nr:hypothetical protein [Hyphomicrobiales bacterium]
MKRITLSVERGACSSDKIGFVPSVLDERAHKLDRSCSNFVRAGNLPAIPRVCANTILDGFLFSMNKLTRYRQHALEAVKLAAAASASDDKALLLKIAQGWLDLAEPIRGGTWRTARKPRSLRPETSSFREFSSSGRYLTRSTARGTSPEN